MEPVAPSQFYTGLVSELYRVLRSHDPDPEPYARFVTRWGTPALELGCGDGDPLLELRMRGLDVHGLDSSADMVDRCRARAEALGLDVVLHHAAIEEMDLGRRYRSIFLAGPTFNLLTDDDVAARALGRIAAHLEPGGAALVPLFIPPVVDPALLPRTTEQRDGDRVLRCTTLAVERDDGARRQSAVLRYERSDGVDLAESLERAWHLHWYTQAGFARLATDARLRVQAVVGLDGRQAPPDATQFTFVLAPA